ncbi:MAG TPA: tripartite tricarboxylate transporter substrate binding protein [Burkholderiales bacterium]|nr:tripartite tricarboxylate transporter substrate binding protein [Burkholderiales bacterium]
MRVTYLGRIALPLALLSGAAGAQGYPEKTVVMVAPFPAGGSVDLVARAIAREMSDAWKQPVIVSNRPGASGNIGAEAVARSAPDGYTLLMGTTALAGSPAIYPKLGYDLLRDLTPVTLVVTMMNVLVVHPSIPARSVKELLVVAKARPGTLNSASAGVGSSNHLALVLFNMMSGANIAHVPYKGAAPAIADVMGGHVAMTFVPIAAALPPVRGGKLRALGVTAATRSTELPDVPTISEAGVPGYEAAGWNALLAAKATPREIVMKVNGAVREALKSSKVREILAASGADAAGDSPEALGRFLQGEIVKWGKVVRTAGIKPE